MIADLNSKHRLFNQKFILLWIGISLLFIALISIYQWNSVKTQKIHQFELSANNLGIKINGFFDDIIESINSLSFYDDPAVNCEKILPELQALQFNLSSISGITIFNSKKFISCSTFTTQFLHKPRLLIKKPILLGPLKLTASNEDLYMVQERIGSYLISIYFLKSTLENFFPLSKRNQEFFGLFDSTINKMIFYQGPILNIKPKLPVNTKARSVYYDRANMEIILPIPSLKNINLVVRSSKYEFLKNFLISCLFLIIPFIVVSWLFYQIGQHLMRRRFSLMYALSQALKEDQFYPIYQPVWDEKNKRFCGAEVLIRWSTDDKMIMPDIFIDEAERSGLIIPITLNLIKTAFEECKNILQANQELHLSFNVSPGHFKDPEFFKQFYKLYTNYNLRPNQIMFELTERELVCQSETYIIEKMQELRDYGFSLAIDDFGTGQANIHYLHHFPFNYLKIDKIFIHTIGTNSISEAINEGIINLASALGMEIIAEGVETEQQMEYLRFNKVKYIQGWYYSKALSCQQFKELVDKMNRDA